MLRQPKGSWDSKNSVLPRGSKPWVAVGKLWSAIPDLVSGIFLRMHHPAQSLGVPTCKVLGAGQSIFPPVVARESQDGLFSFGSVALVLGLEKSASLRFPLRIDMLLSPGSLCSF